MFKDYTLNRILALFASVGFAFLAIDSTLEHWEILRKEPMSWIPIVFGVAGMVVAALSVLKWNERWIRTLHIFLFTAFLVAAAGLYFHIKEEDDEETTVTKTEQEQKEKDKPILASLAFAGVAAIGLLGTSRKWQSEAPARQT